MRLLLLPGAVALATVAAPLAARAVQTPPGSLIIDRDRADRTTPAPPTPAQGTPPTPGPATVGAGDSGAAIVIRGVSFQGTKVPAAVGRAAEPFVGRHADRATLAALATAMSQAYAKVDVALYTVAVPAQDFANGVIRILVLEGHVEGVRISGDARDRKLVGAYAAKIRQETPLSRTALERYVSLMRDIPGLTVDVQLLTGATPGGVVLALKLGHRKPEAGFTFDNRTTRLFRDGEFGGTAKFYGLLREGDQTDVTASSSLDVKSYRYLALSHSTPLGDEGLRASASAGVLRTRPRRIPITGDAQVASVSLSYPLLRGYKRNLTVSASLDGLNSDNAALGTTIASERTRAARFAAGYSYVGTRRVVSASATVSHGLDILGARAMQPVSEPVFTKVNGRVGLDQAIGKRAALRLRGSAQWTRDRLPAGERFAIGGADYGRAFDIAVITADRGAAASAELAFRPLKLKALSGTELYTFVDGARVRLVPRGAFTGADYGLASTGAGVRLAYLDKAALSLEAAHALDRPLPGLGDDWRFSVGWRLSLGRK